MARAMEMDMAGGLEVLLPLTMIPLWGNLGVGMRGRQGWLSMSRGIVYIHSMPAT